MDRISNKCVCYLITFIRFQRRKGTVALCMVALLVKIRYHTCLFTMVRMGCRVWSTWGHGVEVRILRILMLAVLHGLLMAVLYRVLLIWVRGWINTTANLPAGKVSIHWKHHLGTMYLRWYSVTSSSHHVVGLLALVGKHRRRSCRLPYKWIVFVNFIEVGL